jgi:hypothetical protein
VNQNFMPWFVDYTNLRAPGKISEDQRLKKTPFRRELKQAAAVTQTPEVLTANKR